jgi:GAF domain-containing protein
MASASSFLHRRIAFIEALCHQAGIAVDAERELSEIIAADGKAVDILQKSSASSTLEGISHIMIRRKSVIAALKSVCFQQAPPPPRIPRRCERMES